MKTQDIRNMGLAMQQVQEAEAVQVDELSKKTMGSYIKKATSDVQVANIDRGMAKANAFLKLPKNDKIGVDAAKTSSKRQAGIAKAVDKMVKTEAVGTATHKPNNGQDPEQGLSPNAKKEKARTSGVGVDANKAIDMSFKAFRANSKAAKHNGGVNPPGDKAIVKSTKAPAANQKTESVELDEMIPAIAGMAVRAIAKKTVGKAMSKKADNAEVAEVKQGKSIKGKIGDPIKAAYHGEEKKKNGMHKMPDGSMMKDNDPSMKEQKKKAKKDDKLDDGDGMDPVGKADADIDNDGDVDKTDNYLNNRRDAIRAKMKGKNKAKKEDAVMHGGKGGAKSEKKEKETMTVGEGAMKRMSTGDGMDTYKKKPKDEAFSSRAIVKKDRRGDGKPMGDPRQMKDPKKDSMVSKDGKVKVIDKDKEKDHLKKGFVRAEMNDMPKTMKRPAMPQKGMNAPAASKGRPY